MYIYTVRLIIIIRTMIIIDQLPGQDGEMLGLAASNRILMCCPHNMDEGSSSHLISHNTIQYMVVEPRPKAVIVTASMHWNCYTSMR